MLLRGNGTDGSQTITDERSHTINVFGNTCIKTATKKYGSGSIYFDGTGDYLVTPGTDFLAGTGDFTVDCWVYITAYDCRIMSNISSGGSSVGLFEFFIDSSGKLTVLIVGVVALATSLTVPLNQWTYVAASRVSSVMRLYVNQDKLGQASNSANMNQARDMYIGRTPGGASQLNGYIDDLRYTKYGRYSTDRIRVPAFEASTSNTPPDITLTSIVPHKGPPSGGTFITLTGSGFTDYTTCTIDGNSLTTITTISDTSLTGYTPPGSVGLKDVIVTNP